ncbi:MAG: hypothetical protein H6746_20115 [Deltaproteobacteria bacterium]|nr:hypothetical protein [Deltaproteobacteria bacterium]
MSVARMIPLLLIVGGLAVAVDPIIDLGKSALTSFELSEAADLMYMDWVTNCIPPPESDDELSYYLNENMRSRGGRDVGQDLWGEPYRIRYMDSDHRVLYSTGANRADEACMTDDEYAEHLAYIADNAPGDPEDTSMEPPPLGTDDICVDLHLPDCEAAYRLGR